MECRKCFHNYYLKINRLAIGMGSEERLHFLLTKRYEKNPLEENAKKGKHFHEN